MMRNAVIHLAGIALIALLGGCDSSTDSKLVAAQASDCSDASWIGGTTEICNGVLVYRDYVYDDHGADTSPRPNAPIGSLSPRSGDATYPAGAENTADLVALRLFLQGNKLHVSAELNTLYVPDSTQIALAIDTDNNPETGGGLWEGFGIATEGWDVLHVLKAGVGDTEVDLDANTLAASFPAPAGSEWRLQAVVAQANGTVMNVAFRGTEEQAAGNTSSNLRGGTWWEDKQAAALGRREISAFGHVVRTADLRSGVTRFASIPPGFHQRVYTSTAFLPDGPREGISMAGIPGRHGDTRTTCEQYFHFLGKYQPYGIYLPDRPGPHGLQLVLHGCNANHASLINRTGMQNRFGEDLNRILVVPLGRGPVGWYSDFSERDVLDVIADVRRSYAVDRDRIFAGGYSMGGYGTLRFAALYPDLFAGAVNWVGFTGSVGNTPFLGNVRNMPSGAIGNVIDFVGNLRHIPSAHLYAAEDELVQVHTALALAEAFREAKGVPYKFFLHPVAEHLTFAVLDDWAKEAAYSSSWTRVRAPARVTYRTDASLAFPEYGIRHDRAYWVSGIVSRASGYADVDLTTHGCGTEVPMLKTGVDAGTGPGPLVWTAEYREVVDHVPLERAPVLSGELRNVAALTINGKRACLEQSAVQYLLSTDGPVTIRLDIGKNRRTLHLPAAGTHEGSF